MLAQLNGKVALVTGASRGIGRAAAETLARAGARTWLAARSAAPLSDVADGIRAAGGTADVTTMDLADPASIVAGLQPVLAAGGVDILVNNAGITEDGLLLRVSDDAIDRVLDTDLGGTIRVTRALLRPMAKRRWGRIVSVSSVVGQTGNPGQTTYAAAKAGLIGFTRALAREMASRGITVNAVAPGYVDTTMTGALTEEQRQALLLTVPLGRMGTTDDVAAAILFLASEEAGYVTGHVLNVNGGMYM